MLEEVDVCLATNGCLVRHSNKFAFQPVVKRFECGDRIGNRLVKFIRRYT